MFATTEKKLARPFISGQTQSTRDLGESRPRQPSHDEISRAAFDIYVATGRKQGQCTKNWLQAEQSLRSFGPPIHDEMEQDAGTFAPHSAGIR